MKHLIICLLLSIPILANDTTKYTNHQINIGISIDYNYHNADFFSPPEYFKDGLAKKSKTEGIGYAIQAGYNHKLMLFNMPAKIGGDIVFTDLSTTPTSEAKFSNWINGDNYGDAILRRTTDVSIQSLLLNPYISMQFIKDTPLAVRIGLFGAIILNGSYSQYDEIVSPDFIEFTNGSRKMPLGEGDIPEASAIYAGLQVGVAYDIAQIGNWTLTPNALLNIGITDIVSSEYWRVNSINAGLILTYSIPIPVEPEPPTIQPLPEPIVSVVNRLEMNINTSITNGSTIVIPMAIEENITNNVYMPILFFKSNTANIIEGYNRQLIDILKRSSNIAAEIGIAYSELTNADTLYQKRKETISNLLKSNNITFTLAKTEKPQRYTEIDEEYSYVKFYLNEKYNVMENKRSDTTIKQIGATTIDVDANIIADAQPYKYRLEYTLDDRAKSTNTEKYPITLDEYNLNWNNANVVSKLNINCFISDAEGKELTKALNYMVVPQISKTTYINANQKDNYVAEYIVAFFDFDESEPISIDINALSAIRLALAEGKQIEVIGRTDAFGTQQHNTPLSNARAKSAINQIDTANKYSSQIKIGNNTNTNISSANINSIYARQQARMAIVRILK